MYRKFNKPSNNDAASEDDLKGPEHVRLIVNSAISHLKENIWTIKHFPFHWFVNIIIF
jgi:hypothetical protein